MCIRISPFINTKGFPNSFPIRRPFVKNKSKQKTHKESCCFAIREEFVRRGLKCETFAKKKKKLKSSLAKFTVGDSSFFWKCPHRSPTHTSPYHHLRTFINPIREHYCTVESGTLSTPKGPFLSIALPFFRRKCGLKD